jgi:hypothetical protein
MKPWAPLIKTVGYYPILWLRVCGLFVLDWGQLGDALGERLCQWWAAGANARAGTNAIRPYGVGGWSALLHPTYKFDGLLVPETGTNPSPQTPGVLKTPGV